VDGMTAAYQRMLGGILLGGPVSYWLMIREQARGAVTQGGFAMLARRRAWLWVLGNSLAGPTIGVACYQWALGTTPSAVVLPIVATMPIAVIPLAYLIEGDRPTLRSVLGGLVAVAGAVGLAVLR
jgi:drug/metabolite transporter (DMT)-like permease